MTRSTDPIRDELLVLRCQDGELDALEELMERWQQRLWAHAARHADREAAWDVYQESCLAIVHGIRRLQDPASFRAWAYRIVTNKGRDHLARRQRQRRHRHQHQHLEQTNGLLESVTARSGGDPMAETERLRVALDRLSPEHRAVLSLRYLDEMSFLEIADALGIPVGTVKSRLYYARNQLKQVLERQERTHE